VDAVSIVLIGGHERMHELYKEVCREQGHSLKVFTTMPARLEKAIGQPSAIVLFTNTVSHSMVNLAVKTAKKRKIPVVRAHSSSKDSLATALRSLISAN
jgi:ABC-type uncharacterized transport system substrate-binding protein